MHAVIFDIDGTLVQSVAIDESLFAEAIRSVFGPVRFRPGWGDYEFVTDTGILSQVLSDNALPTSTAEIRETERLFLKRLKDHVSQNGPFVEVPGARAYCRALCESENHSVAIATGAWRSSALVKLESARFDFNGLPLATCNDSDVRTEIMKIALSRIGSCFDSITYYGDGSWDEKASNELGWNFIAVGSALGGIDSYFGESAV